MFKKIFGGFAFLLFPILLHGQAVSPVTPKLATFSVGGYFSYGQTDYGQFHAYGPGAYADFDYRIWHSVGIGAEGEARFLDFNTKNGLFEQNFLVGPRVTYTFGRRWVPYGKFLIGGSRFHYPKFITNKVYDYTTLAGGGGLDFHLNHHWTIRPVDFEYQHWDFPPKGLTPWAYSAGVSYRIF